MCNVCVAENALAMTSCRKNTCASLQRGYEIRWDAGPDLTDKQFDPEGAKRRWKVMKDQPPLPKKKRGKMVNHCYRNKPMVFVRARGKGSEFKPAEYQIRLSHQQWPAKWVKTKDLAGSMSTYGLEVKWDCVPKVVQDAILRKRPWPSEGELRKASAKRRKAHQKKNKAKGKKRPPITIEIPVKKNGKMVFKSVSRAELKQWQKEQSKKFEKWRKSAEAKRRHHRQEQDLKLQRVAWRP